MPRRALPPDSDELVVLEKTGDDDSFEYGGGVLYRKNGGYFWQFWEPPASKNYLVWTAKIPRDVLKAYKHISREELASVLDVDMDTLRTMGRSRSHGDRFALIEAISELEGRSTIVGREEELTPWELAQRWGTAIGVDPESVPEIDDDDYIIIEYRGAYGCGQLSQVMLGCFESFESCAAAIADHSENVGNSSNVYFELSPGSLEKVDWTRSRWLGKQPVPLRGHFSRAIWRTKIRGYLRESKKQVRRLKRRSKPAFRGRISKVRV